MERTPGFENLAVIKRDYQWYDLKSRKYGPRKNNQRYCGGVPLLYDSEIKRVYVDSTDTHTLVYGATGSLKTRSIVMPTIKLLGQAGESMIINDAKGELYNRLAGELQELGYNIVVINLREPSKGNCWNPLYLPYHFYLMGDIDRACEFINDIAINLTNDESTSKDPFWDNSAADLAFGLILLLFKYCKENNEDISAVNISNVLALRRKLFSSGGPVPGLNQRPKDTSIWKYASQDELIAARLSGSVFAPNDTMNSILSTFDNKMSIFSLQPTLLTMLANNDFDIAEIGQKKTVLFMVIPDEKTTFSALCSLFIKQSYEYLIFTAMQTGHKTVENRVNYCLDEFSSLPSIADFPAMVTAARSRDIRFLLVVQSQSSLKRKYKEDADTIISNCSNWIFFTSRELGLLRELSELCGMQKNNNRPNISTYDLQHLSKKSREALLLCGRYKPARVSMIDIDNQYFSGNSYEILSMPEGNRVERKALDFTGLSDTHESPDSSSGLSRNFTTDYEVHTKPNIRFLPEPLSSFSDKMEGPPHDSAYLDLVAKVESRLEEKEKKIPTKVEDDDQPFSLEALLEQLENEEK